MIKDPLDAALAPYRLIGNPDALRREGLFAVEGRLVLPRLLASRYRAHSVLVSEPAHAALEPLLRSHPDLPVHIASIDAISQITGFDFHRGCLALAFREEARSLDDVLGPESKALSPEPVVILEAVSNPDNIGGIFRSAHALGARAVVVSPNCADPLYRKSIRTSMGAVLDVPSTTLDDFPAGLRDLSARGYRVIAMVTDAGAPALRDVIGESRAAVAFLLGSEGYGLSTQAREAATATARIPMASTEADSLNVTAAATIALYEYSRNRLG
jgi:tRNA G18 (ribose-2'-O)-methylase SpoU